MQGCTNLSQLPGSVSELCRVKELLLRKCTSLSSLPEAVGQLRWSLTWLHLSGCTELQRLPETLGRLEVLELLEFQGCGSLIALPESVGQLQSLTRLQVSGCTKLGRLPETLGGLSRLEVLELPGCGSLITLPYDLAKMTALRVLDLQSCNSLKSLPRTLELRAAVSTLDMSYCSEVGSLAESVVRLSDKLVAAEARVGVQGWGVLVQGLVNQHGSFIMTATAAQQLRRATIVQQLLADRSLILDLLLRLSWMGVLLGAATFTAALAAPNGGRDVPAFFTLDVLSFGFSMMLVVFVVACSVPHTGRLSSRAEAGMIWLSLLLASLLLILAAMCGMLALLFGVWDGFAPAGRELCVALPLAVCMVLTALLCMLLMHRLAAVFPGGLALAAAAESVVGSKRWEQLQQLWGKCWQKLQQCWPAQQPPGQQQQHMGQQLQQVA